MEGSGEGGECPTSKGRKFVFDVAHEDFAKGVPAQRFAFYSGGSERGGARGSTDSGDQTKNEA